MEGFELKDIIEVGVGDETHGGKSYYPKDLNPTRESILKDLSFGRRIEHQGSEFSRPDLIPVSAEDLQALRQGKFLEWDESDQPTPVRLTDWGSAFVAKLLTREE